MMRKRICIVLSLVMLISTLLIPQNTFAASLPYRSISSEAEYNGLPLEKTGKYYIWESETRDEEYNLIESSLCCSQDGKDKTILRRVPGSEGHLDYTISTNGKTIYYGIWDITYEKCKIYKTTVEGKSHKLITTIKNGWFVGCFSNKIYYCKLRNPEDRYHPDRADLYQYDLKTKKHKRIRKDFRGDSMYGQYVLGTREPVLMNETFYVIDLKTGKRTSLPYARMCTTDGKYVYYVVTISSDDGNSYSLRRCSMKGKSVKKLKNYKNAFPHYVGRTSAYFRDHSNDDDKLLKYTY